MSDLPLHVGSTGGRCAAGGPVCVPVGFPAGAGRRGAGGGESTRRAGRAARDLPLRVAGEPLVDSGRADLVDARQLGLRFGGILALVRLGVAVEVQVDHHVPLGLTVGERAT